MLKNYVVGKLSSALSDYLVGVTTEGVKTSLGLDVGELDLKAEINPKVLRHLGLEVLSSRVEAHAFIPWRNLNSKPTRLKVSRLELVARLLPTGACQAKDLEEERAAHRAAKLAAVKQLEDEAKVDSDGTSAGRVARLGKLVLRQIQVDVSAIHVQVDPLLPEDEPLMVELESASLASLASDWCGNADPQDGNTYKRFQLHGLCLRGGERHILGPLALQVKLSLLPKEELIRLEAASDAHDVWQARLTSADARSLKRFFVSALAVQPAEAPMLLSEEAGREYALLHATRVKLGVAEVRLLEIEDAAPVEWLAAWRSHVAIATKAQPEEPPKRKKWWMWSGSKSPDAAQSYGASNVLDDTTMESILELDEHELPKLGMPNTLEIDVCVPCVRSILIGYGSSELCSELRGAQLNARLEARPAEVCQTTTRLWRLNAGFLMKSFATLVNGVRVIDFNQTQAPSSMISAQPILEVPPSDSQAVRLEVCVGHRDVHVQGTLPFDMKVSARVEPIVVQFDAVTLRTSIAIVTEVVRGFFGETRSTSGDTLLVQAPVPQPVMPSDLEPGDLKAVVADVFWDGQTTVMLDLHVKAPEVRWKAPCREVELAISLGSFRLHTCAPLLIEVEPMGETRLAELPAAEPVALDDMACACDLSRTCVLLIQEGARRQVYGPSTFTLRGRRRCGRSTDVDVYARAVEFQFEPDIVMALGQLKQSMLYALSPLAEPGEDAASLQSATPESNVATRADTAKAPSAPASGADAKESGGSLRLNITFDNFEFSWGPQSSPVVLARLGSARAEYLRQSGLSDFTGCVSQVSFRSAGAQLVSCQEELRVAVHSGPKLSSVKLSAPPVVAKWAVGPVGAAMMAARGAGREFAAGEAMAEVQLREAGGGQVGPPLLIHRSSMTQILWDRAGQDAVAFAPGAAAERHLEISFASLSLTFEPDPSRANSQELTLVATEAHGTLTQKPDGEKALATLASATLDLGKRRILMGRRADGDLLSVRRSLGRDASIVHVEWAQMALVLRWRDVDAVRDLITMDVLRVLVAERPSSAVVGGVVVHELAPAGHEERALPPASSISEWREPTYTFSIGAPLMFMPMDMPSAADQVAGFDATLMSWEVERHDGWQRCPEALNQELRSATTRGVQHLTFQDPSGHFTVNIAAQTLGDLNTGETRPLRPRPTLLFGASPRTQIAESRSSNFLSSIDGEARFESAPGEGFLIFDLGHLDVTRGEDADVINFELRDARGFAAQSDESWSEVMCPVGVSLSRAINADMVSWHAQLSLNQEANHLGRPAKHLKVTRSQMSLIFDVGMYNMYYSGYEQADAAAEADTGIGSSASFIMAWITPLRLEVGFMEGAPLAMLELADGACEYSYDVYATLKSVECKCVRIYDRRLQARNADKTFIECHAQNKSASSAGFCLALRTPSDIKQASKHTLDIHRCVILLLPQLYTDLNTWFLSAYEQSAMAKPYEDSSVAVSDATRQADPWKRETVIQVWSAAVKVAVSWDDTVEWFEIGGDVSTSLVQEDLTVQIKELRLSGGTLLHATPGRVRRICERFELSFCGAYRYSQSEDIGKRFASLAVENLTFDPFVIQLGVKDRMAMAKSIATLSKMDAESAEPAAELLLRDPLAAVMQERFHFSGSVQVGDITIQLLDENSAFGAKPLIEVALSCPLALINLTSATGEISAGSLQVEQFRVAIWSFHTGVNDWEPLLVPLTFTLNGDCGPNSVQYQQEAVLHLAVSTTDTVHFVLTTQTVQTISALLPEAADGASKQPKVGCADTWWGLNLSGMSCAVSLVGGNSLDFVLGPADAPLPMDAVLHEWEASREKDSSMSPVPQLQLRILDLAEEASEPFLISLVPGSAEIWESLAGILVAKVLVPQPGQRLLLLCSTVTILNTMPSDVDVRFLAPEGDAALPCSDAPRCVSAACLGLATSLRGEVFSGDTPRAEESRPSAPSPAGGRVVHGEIVVEVVSASGLGKPQFWPGDAVHNLAKGLTAFSGGGPQLTPYVVVSCGEALVQTPAVKASKSLAIFEHRLILPLPSGATPDSLQGKVIEFGVRERNNTQPNLRKYSSKDALIGSAVTRLTQDEIDGIPKQHSVQLLREGNDQGSMVVRIWLQTHDVSSATSVKPAWSQTPESSSSVSSIAELESGTIRVRAGHVLVAPLEAVWIPSCATFQVRPATTHGRQYSWGPPLETASLGPEMQSHSEILGQGSRSTDGHLHLQASLLDGVFCEVRIGAPVHIANACPCEVMIALGRTTGHVNFIGAADDSCDTDAVLTVLDGFGGRWEVQLGESIDISPLKLDADACFSWYAPWLEPDEGTAKLQRTRSRWRTANFLRAGRSGARVIWTFGSLRAYSESEPFAPSARHGSQFALGPQKEFPVLNDVTEGILFSVALREQYSGALSTWSDPIPLCAPQDAPFRTAVRPQWQGQPVVLTAMRQTDDRRVVIFAENWFADATSLNIGLSLGPRLTRLPMFGNSIALPGELEGDSPLVYLSIPGHDAVEKEAPLLGSSVVAELSPLHECVLMVESIATAPTYGVPCSLLSVAPRLMVFSRVEGCEIGFRQEGCDTAIWLGHGTSSPMYWSRADRPKNVAVAVRVAGLEGSQSSVFHGHFKIDNAGIGAYPLVFPTSGGGRRLVCVEVDQSGQLFNITATDESSCHQLVNNHPCLDVEARYVDEALQGTSNFKAGYAQHHAIGQSKYRSAAGHGLLKLTLRAGARRREVVVSLDRTSCHRDAEAPAVLITVELRARVAVVSINPMVRAVSVETPVWGFVLDVRVPILAVSLVGEKPHEEVFTITLEGLTVGVCQNGAGQQSSKLVLDLVQVDFHPPLMPVDARKRNSSCVVLSSSTRPAVDLRFERDDINARDVMIRSAAVNLGKFEVSAFDVVVEEAQRFARSTVIRHLGLELDAVLARARLRYDLVCGPSAPSQRYVIKQADIGSLHLTAFCRLSPRVLPGWLVAVITLTSGFAQVIQVQGARLHLHAQNLLDFRGNRSALLQEMVKRYARQWFKMVMSLLGSSNVVFGGLFSRKAWAPRSRAVQEPRRRRLRVAEGTVVPILEKWCNIYMLSQAPPGRGRLYISAARTGDGVSLDAADDASGRQRWMLTRGSGEWYHVRVLAGASAGLIYLSAKSDGRSVDLSKVDDGTGRQRWLIEKGSGDWYSILILNGVFGGAGFLARNRDCCSLELVREADASGRQRWIIPNFTDIASDFVSGKPQRETSKGSSGNCSASRNTRLGTWAWLLAIRQMQPSG